MLHSPSPRTALLAQRRMAGAAANDVEASSARHSGVTRHLHFTAGACPPELSNPTILASVKIGQGVASDRSDDD